MRGDADRRFRKVVGATYVCRVGYAYRPLSANKENKCYEQRQTVTMLLNCCGIR